MLDSKQALVEREDLEDGDSNKTETVTKEEEATSSPTTNHGIPEEYSHVSAPAVPSPLFTLATMIGYGMIIGLVAGVTFYQLPEALPADSPSTTFSGMRAYKLLEEILDLNDHKPHNWGDEEDLKVAKYVADYALKLQAEYGSSGNIDVEILNYTSYTAFPYEVRDFVTLDADPSQHRHWDDYKNLTWNYIVNKTKFDSVYDAPCSTVGGYAERGCSMINIAMYINGTDNDGTTSGKAIQISAHHDSAQTSPGASDDGSGLVTVLEMMRLLAQHPPRHDVLLLVYGAEEVGLLGSFVHNKLSKFRNSASTAINIEAGGTAVRDYILKCNSEFMIETYAKYSKHKRAYSFVGFVDSIARLGGTDTGNVNKMGVHSIDLVFLEDRFRYHTAQDDIDFVKPGGLQHVGDNVLGMLFGLMQDPSALPERYQPGESSSVGSLDNNEYFADEVFEATLPRSVYTTVYGSMWRFPTLPMARVLFVVVVVLVSLLSTLISRLTNRALGTVSQSKCKRASRLLKDFGFAVLLFVNGLVCGVVGYMITGTTWKDPEAYFGKEENTFRIALVFVSVALGDTLAVWLWVYFLSKREAGSKNGQINKDADQLPFHLSERLYNGIHAFNLFLLFVMALVFVHMVQQVFWIPLFMYLGQLFRFLLIRFGGLGNSVATVARDFLGCCIGVVMLMDVGSVLVNVFPYYFPLFYVFGAVVGLYATLSIMPFLPLLTRLLAEPDNKIGKGFVSFMAIVWVVLQIASAAGIVAFDDYPKRACSYAKCSNLGRE